MTEDAFGLPPLPNDLRAATSRLRERSSPPPPASSPPSENGVRLATIPRGDEEELRLSWAEYNGRNLLNRL